MEVIMRARKLVREHSDTQKETRGKMSNRSTKKDISEEHVVCWYVYGLKGVIKPSRGNICPPKWYHNVGYDTN